MSLQDKIDYLNETKSLIRQSIINKGVNVTEQDTFRSYAGKIDQIQQGGTTPEPTGDYRVRFYDYDGTYKDVWVNEGEDAVPPEMPDYSQEGYLRPPLTLQEWNRPYTNITRNEETGAVYIPTDGKTHFYLQITGGTGKNITLYLRNSENCNIVINWGDGTADYSSAATEITASHTFADYGIYHCTIENTSTGDFRLGQGSAFCGGSSQQMRDALIAIYLGEKVQLSPLSFLDNHALKYVTIPNGVTIITDRVFWQCYSLTNMTIPSSVTVLDSYATFYNCYSLTNITIPNSVTSIWTDAFYQCYSLTNIIIPSGVTSIPSFGYCYSLATVTIPNSVTRIHNGAFQNCYSLSNITIPNSVTMIENVAFNSCYSLKKVLIEGDTVKTLQSSNAFTNIPRSALFFVKDELVDFYKVAANWVTYANRILPMSEEGNYFG